MNRADVGMVDRGKDLSFASETRDALRVVGQRTRQHFQCDASIELAVFGSIDLAHSADAQQANDLKRANLCPGGKHLMSMRVRHAETIRRIAFKIELDDDNRLLAALPAVLARFDREDMRRLVLDDATVRVLDVDF